MQPITKVADMLQSFKLVNEKNDINKSNLKDYGLKKEKEVYDSVIDIEENVKKMRIYLRARNYLNKPAREKELVSLSGQKLNPELEKILPISQKTRQQNVLNVLRYKDFTKGYDPKRKFKVLKSKEDEDSLGLNFENQLEILIETEDDIEARDSLREYVKQSRSHPDFDPEKLVTDILERNFEFSM